MSTMRIYIAGPMSGLPDFNYPAFDQAEGALLDTGYDAVSPAVSAHRSTSDSSALAEGLRYEDVLARSLQKLLSADAVALLEGWEESHGARIEVSLAHLRGIPSAPVEHWVSIAQKKDEQAASRHAQAVSVAQRDLEFIAAAADSPERRRRLAEHERAAASILVDALGTPAALRESLTKLGSGSTPRRDPR